MKYKIFTLIIVIMILVFIFNWKYRNKIIDNTISSEKDEELKKLEKLKNSSINNCKYFGCKNEKLGYGLIPDACMSCTIGIIISSNT